MRLITFFFLVSAMLGIIAYQSMAQNISWEAENFAAQNGDAFEMLTPPFEAPGTPDLVEDYTITEAYGDVFVGIPVGVGGDTGSWLKYQFSAPTGGDWYFWGRFIAPSSSNNSVYWAFDIDDASAVSADNATTNIWDFFEDASLNSNATTEWVWFRLNSRTGPFPGVELDQYGDNPTPMNLTAGSHTLYIIHREEGVYIDAFFATMDQAFDANETPPTAVEPQNKLATTWGDLKDDR